MDPVAVTADDMPDERARRSALDSYGILDTPPEQGFDDIVLLASQICGTPVALVTLLDRDRQWFKARLGTDICETPIGSAICRHALGRTDVLVIPDLAQDPRTAANPLVTEPPHLRFYAGAPLVTPDGVTLGTICVLDTRPRPDGLTREQETTLAALARHVMAQLELRRAVTERDDALELRQADQRTALAQAARLEAMIATQQAVASAAADLGIVFQAIVDGALRVIDAADGAVVELRRGDALVYEAVAGSLGPHRGLRLPLTGTLSGRAVREERPLLCSDTQADPDIDQALVARLGIRSMVVVPVTRRGEPIGALKVQSGRPHAFSPRDVVMTQMLAGLVASAFGDVAEVRSRRELREADARYRRTFESVTEFAIIVTDRAGTITEWNTGAERIFGWSADEMRGSDASRFFTPEDRAGDRPGTEMALSLREGRAVDERWHLRKDGGRLHAGANMMPLLGDAGEHLGFIKIVRDRTDQHEASKALAASRRALEESEAKWRGLFEQLEEGFILGRVIRGEGGRIVDWEYEEVNRAWGELVGIAPEAATGRTIRELIPGIEDAWVNEFADVVETGQPVRFTRQVGTFGRWYDGVAQPIGDDRFTVLFLEVTQRVRAQARADALAELARVLLELSDPDEMSSTAAAIIGRALDVGRVGYGTVAEDGETFSVSADWTRAGVSSLAGVHRLDDYGLYAEDLRGGRTVVIPDVREDSRTSGDTGPLESLAVRALVNHPIVENGRTVAILYVNDREPRTWSAEEIAFLKAAADRTRVAIERRRAEAELRESQQELLVERGLLQAVIQQAPLGISIAYAGGQDEINARLEQMLGRGAGETGEGREPGEERDAAFRAVDADGRPLEPEAYPTIRALRGGETLIGEPLRYRNASTGEIRRWELSSKPVRDEAGRILAAVTIVIDVEDRLRAEERQGVLNREISHRLKNTLALVSAIVTQTLRTAPDMASARRILSDRIQALSSAHDLLLTGQSDAARVGDVVRSATGPHDPGGRIAMAGPEVTVGPKASLTLSLICHELSTNAVKYGALSVPDGRVDVDWTVELDPRDGRALLAFEWREAGGPPVTAPERGSFGSRLIGMGLSGAGGASSRIHYDPDGLRCRIVAPLKELREEASQG